MASQTNEIAIVGVGCKFPGADNLKEYWKVLKNGENHVKEVPRDRWNIDAFFDPDRNAPGKTYVRTAGFLNSINEWDHRLYGINDIEAELIDPQQRIVLDCVHMALENGGITRNDIEGTQTGVYIGSMTDDYKAQVMDDKTISSTYSVTGTHNSIISARVSYVYNLSGPAMTLDTACSSSLVATDIASQALLTGKCSMAICGGVNILLDPQLFIALSKAGMLSPSGQCKTFTKDADGYARGEGCGIVLLKSLKNAVEDGNNIWGTIKVGTNQDGHMAVPITAPSGFQQERLIKDIYERNKVDKARITVIEAHGTGTAIGDPTEANALGSHFGTKASAPQTVYIGSVKTNIGHLEAAAGVAGLIKVLLMMKYNVIVPSLWYTKEIENPKVKLSEHGFVVPTQCVTWRRSGNKKRIACVNSFGFGGTNAHAIVEEYVQPKNVIVKTASSSNPLPYFITISAFDKDSLVESIQHLNDVLKSQVYDIRALSYTSTCKRYHRPQRKAVFGKTQEEVIAACSEFLSQNADSLPIMKQQQVVFVFCGVGTAWNGMCGTFMKLKPFSQAVAGVDKYLKQLAGWTVSNKFIESCDILIDPMVAHIAIFACQVGLAALWNHFAIQPDIVIGQSVGEVAAAYVAGYVDLQTAVRIIFYRSKFLAEVKSGGMVVVRNVEVETVEKFCKSNGSVNIAVYSSPTSCTISGNADDIKRLKENMSSTENIQPEFIDLEVKCAYHSRHVDDAATKLANNLKGISYQKVGIPVISTVTGQIETSGLFCTPGYWKQNVRKPVLFSKAVKALESETNENIFLEIGPSPVLRAHIKSILTGLNYAVIPSMQKQNGIKTFAGALCKLYELGLNPDWKWMFPSKSQVTDIPVYQFRRYQKLYQSLHAVKKSQGADNSNPNHMFIKQHLHKNSSTHFKMEIDKTSTPFVFQHIVRGLVILPGATYADIGFEIGVNILGLSKQETTISLEFLRPVRIEKGVKLVIHISTIEQKDEILFLAKHNHVTMCKGWVRSTAEDVFSDRVDTECLKLSISNQGCRRMYFDEMYENLQGLGFQYGPYFKLMKECITNGTESFTEIEVPDDILKDIEVTTIHPCVLDAMIQTSINTTTEEVVSKVKKENLSFLPVAIGELRVQRKAEKKMFIFTKRINTTLLETVLKVHYNILLVNTNGVVVADLQNYTTYGKRNASIAPCELDYHLTWHPVHTFTLLKGSPFNVLLLTNKYDENLETEVCAIENITIMQNKEHLSHETYIASAFRELGESTKAFDAVLFLICSKYEYLSEITTATASDIHACVRQNCMLLAELVKFMTNNGVTSPLYIATQNTQPTFCTLGAPTINLVGEELWGFVRSIHLEFIHGEITLIDLQPSFHDTKETLFKFIYHSCQNIAQTKPEIIVHFNKIFGGQFTKVPKKEIIPTLRKETKSAERLHSLHKVLALRSKKIKSLILSISEESEQNKKETVNLRIKSVCIHPSFFYPPTTSGIHLDQDVWEETLNDGHSLFALEYTGLPVSQHEHSNISCRRPESQLEEDIDNQWELLCLHPQEIKTEMFVPKSCTVSLKDIPFYQPGLLLYTSLAWRLSEYVPNRSSVAIYSRNALSEPRMILEHLLQNKRNVHLVDSLEKHEDAAKWIDVLISLEKIDPSFVLLGRCRQIICLEDSVSENIRKSVSRSTKQSMYCFSAIDLLDKNHVRKSLPKIVSWLQRYYQKCNKTNIPADFTANATECSFPCRSIDIIKDGRTVLPSRNPIHKLFSKKAVYIITGGLTGLGWELTRLIAEMGAGFIATISRRQVTQEKRVDIANVEKDTGCKIICVLGDVTDIKSVEKAFEEIKAQSKLQVRGVFHGAGVLMGKLLMNLEEKQLDFVLSPKVIGTLNVHIATQNMNLDYFVVSSSINSLIGSPGQSSYGAANSFLDTFIEWRRRRGLAGQAINWGALCVGMASRPEFVDNFTKRGFNLLSVLEIRSCFQEALMKNSTCIIYTNVNWDISAKDYTNPKLERTRLQLSLFFEQALSHAMSLDNDGIDSLSFDIEALQNAGKVRQMQAITQVILKVSSKVIGGDTSQIKSSSTLAELSFDSMSTVTFINIVHDITGQRLAPSIMIDTSNTLDDIIQLLHDAIFKGKNISDSEEAQNLKDSNKKFELKAVELRDGVMTPVET